jgi:signal transduction histidine kinase/ActR/RegA family two-component response regulator
MPLLRSPLRTLQVALVRVGLFLATAAVVFDRFGMPTMRTEVNVALAALFLVLLATLMLWAGQRERNALGLASLCTQALAVGAITCFLLEEPGAAIDPRLPFVAGYLVTLLVAVVGHRAAAALLGALAGCMVLGLGLAFLSLRGGLPDAHLVLYQFAALAAVAADASLVLGGVHEERHRQELSTQVEQEIRKRDLETAEQAAFAQALLDCTTPAEVLEALLRHIRCHVTVGIHAVAFESGGVEAVQWEEAARLSADDIERRRVRLQAALQGAGASLVLRRLPVRSTSSQSPPDGLHLGTAVAIPIHAGGRAAGVVLVGDAARNALGADRIGLLADAARRCGETLQRMDRLRGIEHRRTALLLRQMREGVLLLAPDGQVLMANPAAQRALDASRQGEDGPPQLIGPHSLADLAGAPPGAPRRFRAQLQPPDREQAVSLVGCAVGLLDGSRRVGTIVTLTDVTEEEMARQRILQSERMTLVGQTLAGVAHELNNPLAALIGYADLLRGQEMPDAIRGPVHKMREQAVRATRIVRNLLDFARQRNPERHVLRLQPVVEAVLELFAYEARIAGVQIKASVPDDLPPVLGDRHALQQIVVNLVQNALHALENHPGERHIQIEAASQGDGLTLCVRDTGPGVPEELRQRVFTPFFTTKAATKGTGLGLALARSVARDHGGELTLDPGDGGGACFTVRLPAHLAKPAAPAEAERRNGVPALAGSVLVVDDEPSVREILVAQLGHMGSHADSAGSAREAERLLHGQRYDAVLLDLRMPGASGLDIHRDLARRDPMLAQRVVFMTGDFVNDDLLKAVQATGNAVLEKPFSMDEMARAIERAMRHGPLGAFETLTA